MECFNCIILIVIGFILSFSECHRHNGNYVIDSRKITLRIHVDYDKKAVESIQKTHSNATKKLITEKTTQLIEKAQRLFNNHVFDVEIELKLLTTKFLKRNSLVVDSEISASQYLQAYCDWQTIIKEKRGIYYTVLFTGHNIYAQEENRTKNFDKRALSYRNSHCKISKSCTLIQWQEHNLEYTLAHEIGHSLGMRHDTETGHCSPRNSIMTARFKNKKHFPSYKFTECNAADLASFLESSDATCLVGL